MKEVKYTIICPVITSNTHNTSKTPIICNTVKLLLFDSLQLLA